MPKLFALHVTGVTDPWKDAPPYEIELREMIIATMNQNELILAKLENRATYLTPEDQAKLDQIFKTATGGAAKLSAANPAPVPPLANK
ncbi:MAG: hypothetical protein JWP25_8972 [Bradyrhizobium sp.]|nr:hypothetical protein [Bradyrhizobium sp.]